MTIDRSGRFSLSQCLLFDTDIPNDINNDTNLSKMQTLLFMTDPVELKDESR